MILMFPKHGKKLIGKVEEERHIYDDHIPAKISLTEIDKVEVGSKVVALVRDVKLQIYQGIS